MIATIIVWVKLTIAVAIACIVSIGRIFSCRLCNLLCGWGLVETPSCRKCLVTPVRVAVIGGGIAGTSAAWALSEMKGDGVDVVVTLYESRDALGGNAKTFVWGDPNDERNHIRCGLSVLAWPAAYFKNYELLLKRLNVRCEQVQPKFLVSLDGATVNWAHGSDNENWKADMQRWDAAVAWIRKVNFFFAYSIPEQLSKCRLLRMLGIAPSVEAVAAARRASHEPSFYDISFFNPINLLTARFVMCSVFGVSSDFWMHVVVPVYSSSFLTGNLNDLPATIIPALDDIISVGEKEPLKPLHTWSGDSSEVFEAMSNTIGHSNIHLNAKIERVTVHKNDKGRETIALHFTDSKTEHFDRVIFACPASSVDKLTQSCPKLRSFLFNTIIRNTRYETERDRNFVDGDVHTDIRVIPSPLQPYFFSKRFSNYVRVLNAAAGKCCNVFCLGTWIPPSREAVARPNFKAITRETRHSGGSLDMYVSYDAQHNTDRHGVHQYSVDAGTPQARPAPERIVGHVDNSFAHPILSVLSLALAAALRYAQGAHGAYYCGSYATPGNGHDLSHLSGLAAAAAVVESIGVPIDTYVHHEVALAHERHDFVQLRRLMGL